jgi:hypothetical protein
MASDRVYGFSRETADKLLGLVGPGGPPRTRRTYGPVPSIDVFWVKADSLTLDDGRYPGIRCDYDAGLDAFSEVEDIWVVTGDGTAPELGQVYPGVRHGVANGREVWQIDSDKGVTSVNGMPGPAITHAVGTIGTDHNIAASGGTVTHNIPDAGASARGVVTTGSQTISGTKTFRDGVAFAHPSSTPNASAGVLGFSSTDGAGVYGIFNYAGMQITAPPSFTPGLASGTYSSFRFANEVPSAGYLEPTAHYYFAIPGGTSVDNLRMKITLATPSSLTTWTGHNGAFAGLNFIMGFCVGGTLSVPGSAVTGTLAAGTTVDGGTF